MVIGICNLLAIRLYTLWMCYLVVVQGADEGSAREKDKCRCKSAIKVHHGLFLSCLGL